MTVDSFYLPLLVWQMVVIISQLLSFICIYKILKSNFKLKIKILFIAIVLFIPILGALTYLLKTRKNYLLD